VLTATTLFRSPLLFPSRPIPPSRFPSKNPAAQQPFPPQRALVQLLSPVPLSLYTFPPPAWFFTARPAYTRAPPRPGFRFLQALRPSLRIELLRRGSPAANEFNRHRPRSSNPHSITPPGLFSWFLHAERTIREGVLWSGSAAFPFRRFV